jgi:hypothetical protein
MAQNDNTEETSRAKEARESDLKKVEGWLERQGLAEHKDAFREAGIGWKTLPKVTEAHLEHMKIPLGHRIELLEEMRKISRSTEQPFGSPKDRPLPANFHSTSPRLKKDQERRDEE